jgi:hypothetical protein
MDSVYTPVKDVGYKVEYTRVGDITNFERLTINIETNGTISPKDALLQSTQILISHFNIILDEVNAATESEPTAAEAMDEKPEMAMPEEIAGDDDAEVLTKWGISHGFLTGRDGKSFQAMRDFTGRKIRFLVTHPRTASHGLRFPQCRNQIFYSMMYSPDEFTQARLRTYRPPQVRDCYQYLLLCEGTVDEEIWAVQQGHQQWHEMAHRILAPEHNT